MSIESTIEELEETRDGLVTIAQQLVGKTRDEIYSTHLLTLLYEFLYRERIIQFDFGEDGTAKVPRVAIRGEILV